MQQIIAIETGATDILSGTTGSTSASMDAKGQGGEFSSLLSGQKEVQAKPVVANKGADNKVSQHAKDQNSSEIEASSAKPQQIEPSDDKGTKHDLRATHNDTPEADVDSSIEMERLNMDAASFDFFDLITASNEAELAVKTESELSEADSIALNEMSLQKLVLEKGAEIGSSVKGDAKGDASTVTKIAVVNTIQTDDAKSVDFSVNEDSLIEETKAQLVKAGDVVPNSGKIDSKAVELAVKDVKFSVSADVAIENPETDSADATEHTINITSQQSSNAEVAAKTTAEMAKSKIAEQVQATLASSGNVKADQAKEPLKDVAEIVQASKEGGNVMAEGKEVSAELAKQIEILKSVSEGKVVIASETPPTKMPAAEQLKTVPLEEVAKSMTKGATVSSATNASSSTSATAAANASSSTSATAEQFADVIDVAELEAVAEEPALKADVTAATNKQFSGNANSSTVVSPANHKLADIHDALKDDVVELESVDETVTAKSAEVTNIRAPVISTDGAAKSAVAVSKEELAQTTGTRGTSKDSSSEQDMQQGKQSKDSSEVLADNKQVKANSFVVPETAEFRPFGDAKMAAAMSERAADSQIQQASDNETKFKSQLAQLSKDAIDLTKNDFATKMRDRMLLMAASKVQSLEIKLDPAELGSINVRVQMQGEQATVTFAVQQAQTKDALESAMPKLKDMMEQQGLQLSDSHVEQQGQQEFADSGQNNNSASSDENGEEVEQATEIDTRTVNLPPGRVDFYA